VTTQGALLILTLALAGEGFRFRARWTPSNSATNQQLTPITYRLKIRTDGQVKILGETTGTNFLAEGVAAGTHEVFATAVSATGEESDPSNVVTISPSDTLPEAPRMLRLAK